jgi:hypothetical protein
MFGALFMSLLCRPILKLGVRRTSSIFALFCGVCVSTSCSSPSAPALVIESQDFGKVSPERALVELDIQNNGNQDLLIKAVTQTGDCKAIEWPARLAPGSSGTLKVELGQAFGQNSASVLISSNDPQSLHQVFLSWYGKTTPALDPARLSFHNLTPGQKVSQIVSLNYDGSNNDFVPVIEHISASSPTVVAELVRTNHEAKVFPIHVLDTHAVLGQQDIKVSCSAPMTPGHYVQSCRLLVSWPGDAKEYEIPIELWVVGNLRCPGSLIFGGRDLVGRGTVRRSMKIFVSRGVEDDPRVISPDYLRCTVKKTPAQPSDKDICYELSAELQVKHIEMPITGVVTVAIPGEQKEIPVVVQAVDGE